jgi:hypothetical protein
MLSTGGSTCGYFGAKFAVSLPLPRSHPACHLSSRPSLCRSRLPINRTYFSRCVNDPTVYLFFCSHRLTRHSRHPPCRCYWSSDDTDLPDILFQCGSGPSPSLSRPYLLRQPWLPITRWVAGTPYVHTIPHRLTGHTWVWSS